MNRKSDEGGYGQENGEVRSFEESGAFKAVSAAFV